MRVGLSYDLKTEINNTSMTDDDLEEYDSVETIEIIDDAIKAKGHQVIRLGGNEQFLESIRREKVEFVFNIAEGRGNYRSREAQIPAVLEMLNIPYSGSDPQCLAICLDKPLAKKIVSIETINTPKWLVIDDKNSKNILLLEGFSFPVIIKPAYEGSSKGIRYTSVAGSLPHAIDEIRQLLQLYRQPIMIEEFIEGDEITVGIIGNEKQKIVGIMRILPKIKKQHFVYSLEVKRDYEALVEYECPALLKPWITNKIKEDSMSIFKALGCRDFARIDFRLKNDGTPYFIEINPLPGLGTYSDLIIMAIKKGWTHKWLIGAVLDAGLKRYSQCLKV